MIADRMGQYASGSVPEMIVQARLLLSFHPDVDLDYLKSVSGQKVIATMASKVSKADNASDWTGARISHKEFAAKLTARRVELGMVDPAHPEQVEGRHNGERRTESKKALIKAIEDAGGKW